MKLSICLLKHSLEKQNDAILSSPHNLLILLYGFSLILMAIQFSIKQKVHNLFKYSPTGRHLDCFQFLCYYYYKQLFSEHPQIYECIYTYIFVSLFIYNRFPEVVLVTQRVYIQLKQILPNCSPNTLRPFTLQPATCDGAHFPSPSPALGSPLFFIFANHVDKAITVLIPLICQKVEYFKLFYVYWSFISTYFLITPSPALLLLLLY